MAIPHPLRRSALSCLLTSDAHLPENALAYHGHLADEDVVDALHGGLQSHKTRWAESAGVGGPTFVSVNVNL